MAGKNTLTPTDWIRAGFRALSVGGPQGINVEAIARGLRVSKGSFYWHFKDVAAFRAAMLHHWVQVATDDIIDQVQGNTPAPGKQLQTLVRLATEGRDDPYGGRLAEAAIRNWARYDKDAADALKSVDAKRLRFLISRFRGCGCSPSRATVHANLLYAALIGLEQLSGQNTANRRKALSGLLDLLLESQNP